MSFSKKVRERVSSRQKCRRRGESRSEKWSIQPSLKTARPEPPVVRFVCFTDCTTRIRGMFCPLPVDGWLFIYIHIHILNLHPLFESIFPQNTFCLTNKLKEKMLNFDDQNRIPRFHKRIVRIISIVRIECNT